MMRSIWRKWAIVAAIGVAISASVGAENLVQNPGFESWTSGEPDNWSNDSGITVEQCNVADSVHGGSYSARITLTTQEQRNADFYSDEFAVTAGTTYEISAWIFDNDPAGKGRLAVWWYDASHNFIDSDYLKYSSNSSEWQQVVDTVTAPDNAAYAKFDIRFYDVSSNWDGDALFYVDDVEFSPLSTNQPPTISNIQQSPSNPTSSDVVTVTADITDPDNDLATDSLFYSTNGGTTYSQLYHLSVSGNTYTYEIPALPDGTTVEYFIMAKDNDGNRVTSDTFSYTVQDIYPPVINEIMYNPSDPPFTYSDEWVEIYNPNDEPYDVSNWVLTDYESDFTIPENTLIPAFGFLVIARDTNSIRGCAEYQDDLGSDNDILLGNAGFQLSNDGDEVVLQDNSGNTIDSVKYDDSSPWPTSPDGDGPSLELKDPSLDNNDGNNWAASSETYGTPGEPNSAYNDNNCTNNYDFEIWTAEGPEGWTVEDGATATEETNIRRRGAKSAKLENTTAGKGLIQRFEVQQNLSYDLRVWVYPSGSADNIRVFMIFTDGVGTVIDSIGPLTVTEADKWQLIRRRGSIPAATQMYLKIRGYNTSKGVSGYVDDVYFRSSGATSMNENELLPAHYTLRIRWFAYTDRIQFIVPTDSPVELEVYSVDGRKIRIIRGKWRLTLVTTNMKSGIYFALAKSNGRTVGKVKFIVVH